MAVSVCAGVLFLLACPISFDYESLSILQDTTSPLIAFTTPQENSAFESTVALTGTIVDYDNEGTSRSGASFIVSSSYSIDGDDSITGELTLTDEGGFSFSIPTASYRTQITVVVTAVDRNGNTGSGSITLVPDAAGPFLAVTSPENYGEYATMITLAGYVRNSASDTSTTEVSDEIVYEMPGTDIAGVLDIGSDGEFSSVIDVSLLSGSRTIEVTADDLNGNETTAVLTIMKPSDGGDISGFSVTPGNKRAVISWDEVAGAQSYTITETNSGQSVTGAASPYSWTGLENGRLYAFRVTAVMPESTGADDAVSAEMEVLPLSERTFAPWVEETGFEYVVIAWRDYTDVAQYIVERSGSPEGPWVQIAKTSKTRLKDTGLEADISYWYRVTPASFPDRPSGHIAAVPGRFHGPASLSLTYATTVAAGSYRDVAVLGDIACAVSSSSRALEVFDVSNPSAPDSLAVLSLGSSQTPICVTMDGDYAYVGNMSTSARLQIIDLSNPAAPEIVGTCVTTGDAFALAVDGDFAYVANWSGFDVVGIATKSAPGVVRNISSVGYGWGVAVSGSYAYVACQANGSIPGSVNGLAVIDITTPASASLVGTRELTSGAYGVAVSGNYAYVADGASGLAIVDLSDVSSASAVENTTVTYADTRDSAKDVRIAGSFAYVADYNSGLSVLNVSDPAHPGDPVYCNTSGQAYAVALAGCYAFVADYDAGIAVIDVSYPGMAGNAGETLAASGVYGDAAAEGGYVYVTRSSGLQRSLDIIDEESGGLAGSAVFPEGSSSINLNDVAIAGDHAYAAVSGGSGVAVGLGIVDISDPEQPGQAVVHNLGMNANGVAVQGPYAYLAFDNNFGVLDISDPGAPTGLNTCLAATSAEAVAVRGDYAYVAERGLGLSIIDVSDPRKPFMIGARVITDTALPVCVIERLSEVTVREVDGRRYALLTMLYNDSVAYRYSCLAVVDVTEPHGIASADFILLPICDTLSGYTNVDVRGIDLSGSYAFVSYGYVDGSGDRYGAVAILDVSDPLAPTRVGTVFSSSALGAYAYDITVAGSRAFVAHGSCGLDAIDLVGNN